MIKTVVWDLRTCDVSKLSWINTARMKQPVCINLDYTVDAV